MSVGNFVVVVAAARRLPPSEFGIFALLIGLFVTATVAHASLVGVPLMVFTARHADRQHELPVVALTLALAVSGVFGSVIVVFLLALGHLELLFVAMLAFLSAQFQETVRRCLMGRLEFKRATVGDALSYLGQTAGVGVLALSDDLTVARVFVVLALTSAVAGAVQLQQLGASRPQGPFARQTVASFWSLGRWLIAINGTGVLVAQSVVWLLAAASGLRSVASFQALITVLGVTNPIMFAINSIVTTAASAATGDPEDVAARQLSVARHYGAVGGVLFGGYALFLLGFPGTALRVFFGAGSPYAGLTGSLRLLVGAFAAQLIYFAAAGVLNAREDTRVLWRAQLAGLLGAVVVAPTMLRWAVPGAVIVWAVSSAARALVAYRAVTAPPEPA